MNQFSSEKKIAIIVGSARSDGQTMHIAQELYLRQESKVYDLNDLDFSQYDYHHENQNDDFLDFINRMIADHDFWILATPVYWYSMSGLMKKFIDRFTDLLTIEKGLGRKLRGKQLAVIASSNGGNLGDQFWIPFQMTADYLGMTYRGGQHFVDGQDIESRLNEFLDQLDHD